MPLLRLEIAMPVPAPKREALLRESSKILATHTGKAETYVMVTLVECAAIFGGQGGPIAFADVRAVGGLEKNTNGAIAKALSSLLKEQLDIAADRIFLNFTEVPSTSWGWRGTTLG